MPPTLAGRIDYQPALPADRDQLDAAHAAGDLTKVTAVYDRPFWRDEGLSGTALTPTAWSSDFDDSPPSGSPGVLFGFVGGDCARALRRDAPAARRSRGARRARRLLRSAGAQPDDYFETRWPRSSGRAAARSASPAPGTLLD